MRSHIETGLGQVISPAAIIKKIQDQTNLDKLAVIIGLNLRLICLTYLNRVHVLS